MKIWLVTKESGRYPDEFQFHVFPDAFYSEADAKLWIKAQKKQTYVDFDIMMIDLDWNELRKQITEV